MDVEKVCAALASKNRLRIAKALIDKPLSSIEVYKAVGEELSLRRESIYKDLEILSDAGVLEKFYDPKEKKLKYRLVKKEVVIRF